MSNPARSIPESSAAEAVMILTATPEGVGVLRNEVRAGA